MFDLSLVELLFIAVVALIVIGPKDLPKVLAAIIGLFRQLQETYASMRAQVDALVKESGIDATKNDIKTIIDEHGKVQEVYDISEFLDAEGKIIISGESRHPERALERHEGSQADSSDSKSRYE